MIPKLFEKFAASAQGFETRRYRYIGQVVRGNKIMHRIHRMDGPEGYEPPVEVEAEWFRQRKIVIESEEKRC